jgi:KDO2-lipid IV(A) lauroyltransferase
MIRAQVETAPKKPYLKKRIGYFWGRQGVALGLKLAELFPLSALNRFASLMGRIGYFLGGKYRRIVDNNLRMAFGTSKTEKEYEDIGKIVYQNMTKNTFEIAKLFYSDPDLIKELVTVDGLEHLETALSKGKGVVAVSAHLGNFSLIGPRLVMEGYPFSLVLRDTKDEMLAKTLRDLRSNVGIESIPVNPRRTCITQSLACLKRNGILFLQIDQNASSQDLWVDFFGWKVPTFKGPVVFSMRTGAPLVPMFIIRDSAGHHRLTISEPYTLAKTDNKEDDILYNTGNLTKLIESYIEQYPAQWWWFHRRWKKARRSN